MSKTFKCGRLGKGDSHISQKYFYYTTMYLLWLLACSITYFYELDCVVFWYSQAN
jgi:hypothetical protein